MDQHETIKEQEDTDKDESKQTSENNTQSENSESSNSQMEFSPNKSNRSSLSSKSKDQTNQSPQSKFKSRFSQFDEEGREVEDDELMSPEKKIQNEYKGKEIDNMEVYLQIEEEIIKQCQERGELWIDVTFPAENKSLYKNPHHPPEWAREVKTIKWMRPHEIAKDAKFMFDKEWDVKQGAFGESWFIGALVIISTRGEFVEKLFIDTEHFDQYGFVSFQFFKNGEWKYVVVDTLLPYDPDSKQICFGQCANPNEFWVPLMEKAYSKLHGNYENIVDGIMIEGLVDLTGGVSEKWKLNEPDTQKKIENNQLWIMIMNYFNQKFHLGCVNFIDGKGTKNAETGPHGILENHYYGILDIREFPKENLKLIRIRNPWGADGGWNGPFSDDSEEWDKHRNLRDELKLVFKSKKSDGTWWMSFTDWCIHFNVLYICKVFPENWQQYSIPSRWQGKSAGGICYPRQEYNGQEPMPEYLQLDSDERWFNNPQFRIKIEKETKIYISLMQEDAKLGKSHYVKCNFMVITNKARKHRIWERPPQQDIISEAIGKRDQDLIPGREITQLVTLKRFEGKPFGYYMIIPNTVTDNKKEEQRPFWLRLFASEPIEVYEMPETLETSVEGSWNDDCAGGKRQIVDKRDNPSWCKNPQYFLNLREPTHLKIILRKTGNLKKTKNVKIGMTICRFLYNQKNSHNVLKTNQMKNNPQQNQLQNQKKNISKNEKNIQLNLNNTEKQEDEYQQEQDETDKIQENNQDSSAQQDQQDQIKQDSQVKQNIAPQQINNAKGQSYNVALQRILQQTNYHLEPPIMEHIERRLQINTNEKFKESTYYNDEVASLYFNWNPTEGPFIIIPSLDQEYKVSGYRLTVYSNNPIDLQKLDENRNAVLIGQWKKDTTDGGCHLYNDPYEKDLSKKTWQNNPRFLLNFLDTTIPTYLKITLALAEKNWKAKTKNVVGGMIGIYLIEKVEGKIQMANVVREPKFIPLNETNEEYELKNICTNGYYIMPATYESKKRGNFIISVHSDQDFTLQALK